MDKIIRIEDMDWPDWTPQIRRIKSAVRMMNENDSEEEIKAILDTIFAKITIQEIRRK